MRGRLQCYMWGWMDGWDGMVIIRHRYSNNTSKLCRTFSALSALVTTIVSNARTLGSDCARILWKCSSSSCSHLQLFNAISRLNVIVIVFIFVHICPRSVQWPHLFLTNELSLTPAENIFCMLFSILNIAKGTTDPGLSSAYQSNLMGQITRSYTYFD